MTTTPSPRRSLLARLALCLLFPAAGGLPAATAQPANDNFYNRAPILGTNASVTGTLANATLEAGEPVIPEVSSGQTAWWTWSAPANGLVTLSATGNGFSPLVAIYQGSDPLNLSLVASNNYLSRYTDCGGSDGVHWKVSNPLTFAVTADQSYQVAVDAAVATTASLGGLPPMPQPPSAPNLNAESLFGVHWTTNVPAGGPYGLAVQFTPAPTNDSFDQPLWLHGPRANLVASNIGAGAEPGEPTPLGNSSGSSVWFAWTAPFSGRAILSPTEPPLYAPPSSHPGDPGLGVVTIIIIRQPPCTAEAPLFPAPDFFPVFAAYTGSAVSALTPAGCQPLTLPGYEHAVAFDAVEGQTYHIAFDGNQGTMGNTPLFLALTRPALNNDFSHRLQLHGLYVIATGYNVGASHEPTEPDPAPGASGKTVWWTWTAPVSGEVFLDLSGSDYAFPVQVFTGSRLGALHLLVTGTAAAAFTAVAGQTYQIAVSDAAGQTGAIQMALQAPTAPLHLARVLARTPREALLSYTALPGVKVLLERSTDGQKWQRVGLAVAHGNRASFYVRPAPSLRGPYYRAIVLDRSAR